MTRKIDDLANVLRHNKVVVRKGLLILLVLGISFSQLRVSQILPNFFHDQGLETVPSSLSQGQKIGEGGSSSFLNSTSNSLAKVTKEQQDDDPHSHFHLEFPLCLVHVGKAAGSSVSCSLGLMYANCEGMPRDAIEGVKHYHLKRNECPPSTKSYLVTLRHPIDRLNSWFWFEREQVPKRSDARLQAKLTKMRNFLFVDCFQTFESLVLALQEEPAWNRSNPDRNSSMISATIPKNMTCPQRAWAAVLGARAFSYHEWYNYEHYWTGLHMRKSDSATIYALRTEHLQDDWKSISTETMHKPVNKRPKINGTNTNDAAVARPPPDHSLSPKAVEILCHALCEEFQYYKRFLQAAKNLNQDQRKDSWKELIAKCPEEPEQVRECSSDLPHFPPLRVQAGQYRQETKKRFFTIREDNWFYIVLLSVNL